MGQVDFRSRGKGKRRIVYPITSSGPYSSPTRRHSFQPFGARSSKSSFYGKILKYNGKQIRVKYGNRILSSHIRIVPHEVWVASHSRGPDILIDDDVKDPHQRASLAYHEILERHFVAPKEHGGAGLDKFTAHTMAEDFEEQAFLKKHGKQEWEKYSMTVEKVHRDELEHIEKQVGYGGKIFHPKINGLEIGDIEFSIKDKIAEVPHFYIKPEFRGKGYGEKILLQLEKEAREKGANQMVVWVSHGTEDFYERHGYKVTKIEGHKFPRATKEIIQITKASLKDEIADESKAGPDYREKAEKFEEAGLHKEAETLEDIAKDEDRHRVELKNISFGQGGKIKFQPSSDWVEVSDPYGDHKTIQAWQKDKTLIRMKFMPYLRNFEVRKDELGSNNLLYSSSFSSKRSAIRQIETLMQREIGGKVQDKQYLYSTIHRGTQKVTSPKQHRFLESRKLPHTHVYRTSEGEIIRKRVNVD